VQRHVDPAARGQQRREERPGPDLWDPHCQVTRGGRDGVVPGAVALGRAGVGALVWLGADVSGRLGVDELLHDRAEQPAHQLAFIGAAHHLEQLEQGRLVVRLVQGRYGRYVTDGLTEASWRESGDPSLTEAQRMLRRRRQAGKRGEW
jgi:hypothetical protein